MQEAVTIIQQVGFPIAAALGLGWFIYKLIMRIVDGMETKLETLDDKVQTSLDTMEERVSTKLDSQYGIIVALIDRVRQMDNDMIRIDSMVRTAMGIKVDVDRLARADGKKDQRKD